ncbi:hypothetical protein CHH83_01925 [Bacillus sp. 7586-K]|nr:hypothetical protein CHH83_01925 [Bacillus sp. 7586-K]
MFGKVENELDRIASEIIGNIYPLEHLQNYYRLGYSAALAALAKNADKLKGKDIKKLLDSLAKSDDKVNEYYQRLIEDEQKKLSKKDLLKEGN